MCEKQQPTRAQKRAQPRRAQERSNLTPRIWRKMAPKWVDEGRFLRQPFDQILEVNLLQNGSKNSPIGAIVLQTLGVNLLQKLLKKLTFRSKLTPRIWRKIV